MRCLPTTCLIAALLVAASPAHAAATGCDRCFAVLDRGGTLLRYRGVLYAAMTSVGRYKITFSRPIDRCVASATLDGPDGSTPIGAISVSRFDKKTLNVIIVSLAGPFRDHPFSVFVNC